MGGFLGDKAKEAVKEVMDDYGMKPGELYESINRTMEVIEEMAPRIRKMEEISDNLDEDVSDLRDEIQEFNDNTVKLAEALEDNSESLDKLADLAEDLEDIEE